MSRWLLSNSKLLLFQKHDDHGSRTSTKHIGVSKLLRNLARKWLLDRIRPCMADFFAPLQAGTALSGVCEVAVLPTRLYWKRKIVVCSTSILPTHSTRSTGKL